MQIVVTGASGFLGSQLVKKLEKIYNNITLIDFVDPSYENEHLFIKADLLIKKEYEKYLKNTDVIFHFASISDIEYSKKNSTKTLETNIISTKNLLDIAVKYKIKQFIFASTIYVNSSKGSFYRISKQSCENIIREYHRENKLNYNILRFGTIFGPGSDKNNSVYDLVKQAITNNKITVKGTGSEIREYLYVEDAIEQTINLLNNKKLINQSLTITGNSRYKLSDLIGIIEEIFPRKLKIIYGKSKQAHYKYTPYRINDDHISKKLTLPTYTDIGEGIISLYNYIKKLEK